MGHRHISTDLKEAAISKVYLMPKFVNIQELVGALSLGSAVNIAGSLLRTKFHSHWVGHVCSVL